MQNFTPLLNKLFFPVKLQNVSLCKVYLHELGSTFIMFYGLLQVLGSAGVIGNPMGFARNVGFGLKDFISASRKGKLQVCKCEIIEGMCIL